MQVSKGIGRITTCLQLLSTGDCRTNSKSLGNMGVLATSTYGDLCPGFRQVGMVVQNVSMWVVWIPPKTVIGNVQMVEVVPNFPIFEQTSVIPPQEEQAEQ